ncbi:hypothetical protein SARC_15792, partial [Sphaeroforma arctica JP610]
SAITTDNGVTIIGFTDLPSRMASVSSQLYATNISHLLDDMGKGQDFSVDMDDEVIGAMTIAKYAQDQCVLRHSVCVCIVLELCCVLLKDP